MCADIVIIIASSVALILAGGDDLDFVASPLRTLRFFQILRMMRMDRRGGSFKLLATVVWTHRQARRVSSLSLDSTALHSTLIDSNSLYSTRLLCDARATADALVTAHSTAQHNTVCVSTAVCRSLPKYLLYQRAVASSLILLRASRRTLSIE